MSTAQKIIKYIAVAFAIFLVINIVSVAFYALFGLASVFNLTNSEKIVLTEDLKEISSEIDLENISELKFDISFTSLQIKSGDKFKVETNNPEIKISKDNDNLVIKDEDHNWFLNYGKKVSQLIIYIPEELNNFDDVKISTGAGEVTIDRLNTKDLNLNFGAGKVTVNNLIVTNKAKIESGAGKAEIKSGEINNLDLDLGVGEFILNAKLTGKNDIDAGIGSLKVDLIDKLENYTIKATKGIGSIKIDGKDIKNDIEYGKGNSYIDIDGGIGSIEIK